MSTAADDAQVEIKRLEDICKDYADICRGYAKELHMLKEQKATLERLLDLLGWTEKDPEEYIQCLGKKVKTLSEKSKRTFGRSAYKGGRTGQSPKRSLKGRSGVGGRSVRENRLFE